MVILQESVSTSTIRLEYKAIKEKLRSLDGLVLDDGFENLVSQANQLYQKATTMRAKMEDIECMRDMVQQLNVHVKDLCKKSGTTTADFIKGMQTKYARDLEESSVNPSSVDWCLIGAQAAQYFCSVSGLETMTGPMDSEPKTRKVAVRTKRGKLGEATIVKEISTLNSEDSAKKETEANMEAMFSILRKRKRVPFLNLVLNQTSFSQTIENVFAFSFLVKDGRAKLSKGENNQFLAIPMNAPSEQDRANGKARNTQFVIRVDYKDWEAMKLLVDPGSELMPHRNPRTEVSVSTQVENGAPVRIVSRNRAKAAADSPDSDGGIEEEEEIQQKKGSKKKRGPRQG